MRLRLLALAVMLAACARNPVTGRLELALLSRESEQRLGDEQAAEVARTMGLVESAALVGYVDAIGQRLARQASGSGVRYRFFVADMPEPNAFALPGGYVYVSRGLLALVNSEDELAGVIGHEIGHVAARHSVQRISRAVPLAMITGISAIATGIVSPTLGRVVGGVGGLATSAILAPYSREQEREADRLGQELAARAGWDPAGLGRMLETLGRDEKLQGASGGFRFFATHPSPEDRVRTVAAYAPRLARAAGPPIASDRTALLARLDGLVVGESAAGGVVDGQRFLHPDLGFTLEFPDRWKIENTRSSVGATEPAGAAAVVVGVAGEGTDPSAAAERFREEAGGAVEVRRLTIGGRPAARAVTPVRTEKGPVVLDVTWVAHRGVVYELIGLASPRTYARAEPAIQQTVASFRALTTAERAGIHETRLRARKAQAAEPVTALARRTGSRWSAAQIAVANGLPDSARLAAGMLVKIAVREPYERAAR